MLNQAVTATTVVGLCLLQAVAAWALLAGKTRAAMWAALLCPLGVLGLCIGRMSVGDPVATARSLRPLELLFLAVNAAAVLAAAWALLRRATGTSASATSWALWAVNTAACAAMVYLAFFFRLF